MPFFVPIRSGLSSFILYCLFLCLVTSCEDQPVAIPDGALTEHTLDLAGTWVVKQVLLNNRDITQTFDFSQIRLTLKMDQLPTDFEIETGSAPFPVVQNGQWQYNDPVYPTAISFSSINNQRSVDFTTPPISGDSSFKISFTLGCPDNIYTYLFAKP